MPPLQMSKDNLVACVASWLQSVSVIPDAGDVHDIKFTDLGTDQVKLEIIYELKAIKI